MRYAPFVDPNDPDGGTDARLVLIDSDSYNINLRSLHDSLYLPPEEGDEIVCVIESGTTVGSTSTSAPALTIGDWPENVTITLRVRGRIQGKGGDGGAGGGDFTGSGFFVFPAENGHAGGPALYTRYPLTLDNSGQIYGGGGGGGGGFVVGQYGGSGGGGAGTDPGYSPILGPAGATGTRDAGGVGGSLGGGAGGNPGEAGMFGLGATLGGDAGAAIDGVSYISFDSTGTIAGPQVN